MRRRPSPPRRALPLGAVVIAMALAACTGQDPVSTSAPSVSTAPASPSASASPTSPYGIPEGASPLSGRPNGADRPILAVKIDNTGAAQPFAGLAAADLVYVQEVEWELTRLLALFSTELPDTIGPSRSARISDIDILAPFGRVAFAFSGAQSKLLPVLAQADLVDVSGTSGAPGWFDAADRPGPTNHMIDVAALMTRAPDAAKATDAGFVFSAEPPAGGEAVTSITAEWGDSTIGFRWDAARNGFVVVTDGTDARTVEGVPLVAATVVIQSVEQRDSGYGDRFGGVTPFIQTVGTGTALVLRDGRVWEATWTRPDLAAGTSYTLADGSPMPFAIGQEWIVLLDRERTPEID